MSDANRFVPTMDVFRRRTDRSESAAPSERAIAEMADYLGDNKYCDVNSEVYQTILIYGAKELENKNKQGLFITGPAGIGKSFGIELLAARFEWPLFTAKMLESMFLDNNNQGNWYRLIEGQDFFDRQHTIVIDDVGTESMPIYKFGTPHNLIADILDHRYKHVFLSKSACRTIVTTNLTDEQFRGRYQFRIDDRINEMMTFAAVKGRSLR